MILAMNIGSTHFALGHKKNGCIRTVRYLSKTFTSCQSFIDVFRSSLCDDEADSINGAIISSVNPALTPFLIDAIKHLYNLEPLLVDSQIGMKLRLSFYDTTLIGSDRIAVCEAAVASYSLPAIVFDFGTATTINVIDSSGHFLGGSILPGPVMGIDALSKNTALLRSFSLSTETTPLLIGGNTRECLISGAIYGNAAMLDGMVERIEKYFGRKATVIVTGGNAEHLIEVCRTDIIHEPELLISGLYSLYESNRGMKNEE